MDCSPPGSSIHGILREEYWSGWPDPAGNLLDPGSNPGFIYIYIYTHTHTVIELQVLLGLTKF